MPTTGQNLGDRYSQHMGLLAGATRLLIRSAEYKTTALFVNCSIAFNNCRQLDYTPPLLTDQGAEN